MMSEYIRGVSSDKLARCWACGSFFLKDDKEGIRVRCFGVCTRCFDRYEGMRKRLDEMYAQTEEIE